MAIVNIDSPEYQALYTRWDRNFLIRVFQEIKFRTILPIFRLSKREESFLDVGCARGNFLKELESHGYSDLAGLDLECSLYPELRGRVRFFQRSLAEAGLDLGVQFDSISVSCMLHHLPVESLNGVAENLARHLKPGGRLYIYEPNMTSRVGRFFYYYFLRLIPSLYRATLAEEREQVAFCEAWDPFVARLAKAGLRPLKLSTFSFYRLYIGRKPS